MSRQDNIKKLIVNYNRRLQKLQEQQALMGLDTPPHILIEIEDIEAKITELETKLELAAAEVPATPGQSPGRPIVETVPPTPPARSQPHAADGQTIFVGRQAQLAELENYWQEVLQQRQGKVVFLTGEAGIGKTSLVRQFSQKVLDTSPGIQYASAQCDQIAGDISPYAPFIQLLNNLTEQAVQRGNHWAVDFAREIGPDILQMVPVAGPLLAMAAKSVDFAWRRRPWSTVSEMDEPRGHFGQQDIFQQFTDTFCNLARKQNPLLLFIDDWHWADASSTNLLFHLARQLRDVPILLLATYRPHDAQARQHPILPIRAEMERYQLCADLSLEFFSRDDLTTYLARRFPQAKFEPVFVDWLLDITNGNALFVTEYVNLLGKEKLLTSNGQLVGDMEQILPPANVEAVIRSRIGYLDREARDMLAYGSVEGEQFTTLVLSRLLDIKPLRLLKRLRAVEEVHQLIASLGQQSIYNQQTTVYRFVHTLVHRTLYNMLETEERVEISRLLLEFLNQIYTQADDVTKVKLAPELVARAGEVGDYMAQASFALVAAMGAAKNYAHVEVLKHSTIGLQALNQINQSGLEIEALRTDLLLTQGRVEDFIGKQSEALITLRQAEALARTYGDKGKLGQILNTLGPLFRHMGYYDQAKSCYEECASLAEQLGDEVGLAWAYHHLGYAAEYQKKYDQALEWHKKSQALWEKSDNRAGIAMAYERIGRMYNRLDDRQQALEWYHRARIISEELGDKDQLARNYNSIGICYRSLGEYSEAMGWCQKALITWQDIGHRRGESLAASYISTIHEKQGNYDQTLEWRQKALVIQTELADKPGMAWSYNGLGNAYYGQGDYDQALQAYNQARVLNEELSGHESQLAYSYAGFGRVYEAQGQYQQTLEWYQKALIIREKLGEQQHIVEIRQRIAEVETKLAAQSEPKS